MDEKIAVNELIEADKSVGEIRSEPYPEPDGLIWCTMNLITQMNQLELKELYTSLDNNYIEDDAMFRFVYQPDILKWTLQPPPADLHCGGKSSKIKPHSWFYFSNSENI